MRKMPSLTLASAVLGLTALSGTPALAQDVTNQCFEVTPISGTKFVALGDVFRQGLLNLTQRKWGEAGAVTPVAPGGTPKRCTGTVAGLPTAAPTSANYYGQVNTKLKYLRMAAMRCDGTAPTDKYFSIGNAIYYRNCNAGAQVGYIYFWGLETGNSSTCFGSTYPEMFAIANSPAVTVARMAATYSGTTPPMASQSDYALGNAMAAIQIAESMRDWLVYPQNYMLIEQSTDPVRVIGGRCPANTPAGTCQNTAATQNGLHPLAWGGAQAAMMTGGWGANNGATSAYGIQFEARATVTWLSFKKRVTAVDRGRCPTTQNWGNLTQTQQGALNAIFEPIFQQ